MAAIPSREENYSYGNLEVDTSKQNHATLPEVVGSTDPELNRDATEHLYYPEALPGQTPAFKPELQEQADEPPPATRESAEERIFGFPRRPAWVALVAAVLVIVGIAVGVSVGLTTSGGSSSTGTSSTGNNTNGTADNIGMPLSAKTKIAATNYTDPSGNENYFIFYQLENKAIYMSAWNSSYQEWIVSPVVDGSTDVSLENVLDGTSLAVDFYIEDFTVRDFGMHLYWMSPTGAVGSLTRSDISSTSTSTAGDWATAIANDQVIASPGSALGASGKLCDDCNPGLYFFFQSDDGVMMGVTVLTSTDSVHVWPLIGGAGPPPVQDTAFAVTNTLGGGVASSNDTGYNGNGSDSINVFYRSDTGTLALVTSHAEIVPGASEALARDLGANTTIAAFGMGWNSTTNTTSNDDVSFMVLTADTVLRNGVQLSYYLDGAWNTDENEQQDLAACAGTGAMAAHRGGRLYCLVEDDSGQVDIVEWAWGGDIQGDASTYSSWSRVGTVNTSPTS
ncbi:hypothetical protein GGR56DRAFT_675666 [Xylariaceae sp. FL0804]|nr:hypothetical protein GGR56DRAFT_675666 [Xylariaceae sp. FL0804]